MPAAALPSMERFLTGVLDAPLAAPLECGMPDCMRGGERTPPGYRIETNIAPSYETKLPDKYESMARLSEATVPYSPAMPATYDRKVGDDIASILDSSFPMWDKRDALLRVEEEQRLVPLSEYTAGMQTRADKYSVLGEAERIAARKEAEIDARNKYDAVLQEAGEVGDKRQYDDPFDIKRYKIYNLPEDSVTLTNNPEQDGYFNGSLKDTVPIWHSGEYFGTGFSEKDKKINFFVDKGLRGTSALAYVVNIPEISESYPAEGRMLERAYGSNPLMALNPDVIRAMNPSASVTYIPGMVSEATKQRRRQLEAILGHEKFHLKQKGAIRAKQVTYPVLVHLGRHIATGEDVYMLHVIPVGEAFVEGGVEVAMKARGLTPPTDYFPENSLYKQYRSFVENVEEKTPGFTKQFLRVARKHGSGAAAAYMDRVAGDTIVEYLRELNPRTTIMKLPGEQELYEDVPAAA